MFEYVKAWTKRPIAQNRALLNLYQLQFGRSIPKAYFEIYETHFMIRRPCSNQTMDVCGSCSACDGELICDFCQETKIATKVASGYHRQNMYFIRSPGLHEYVNCFDGCTDCLQTAKLIPFNVETIHAIHRKLHYKLCD